MKESAGSIINQLTSELSRGSTGPYLLFSTEAFLVEGAVKAVTQAWLGQEYDSLQIINLNSRDLTPDHFLSSVLTFGMFAQRRLALLRDAGSLNSEVMTAIADSVSQIPPETLLLCTIVTADKKPPRSKLAKAISGAGKVIELPTLRGTDLYRWVRQTAREMALNLDQEVEAELVATFGADLLQLRNELEKLATFVGKGGEKVNITDLKAVIGKSALHSIFDLTDALGAKNLIRARQELSLLLQSGENPMYIMSMLQWHLSNLWQCKAAGTSHPQALAKMLNLHPYVAGKSLKQAANFSLDQLESSYLMAVDTEFRLKTGKAPRIDVELDRLLVKSITNC